MKNVLITILVIAVLVLGYLQFKPKTEVTVSPTPVSPSGQTTTINNPNDKDYEPSNSSSQISSNKDLKTYTNSQLGFSFKYPSTWKTPTSITGGNNVVEVLASEAITTPFIAHYTSGLTLDNFISEAYGHSTSDTPQQITVSEQKGYKYSYSTSVNGRGVPYPLYNQQVAFEDGKGGLFVINFAVNPTNKIEGIATFNQLISSFTLQ